MSKGKLIRAAIGLIIVVALGIVVLNWYKDFKAASVAARAAKAVQASVEASAAATPTATVGVTKIGGVNFRSKPSSSGKLIRALKRGEKLTVLLKDGKWYKVKDKKGKTGWVTADSEAVMVELR